MPSNFSDLLWNAFPCSKISKYHLFIPSTLIDKLWSLFILLLCMWLELSPVPWMFLLLCWIGGRMLSTSELLPLTTVWFCVSVVGMYHSARWERIIIGSRPSWSAYSFSPEIVAKNPSNMNNSYGFLNLIILLPQGYTPHFPFIPLSIRR